jgi:subtilisin family serine protease
MRVPHLLIAAVAVAVLTLHSAATARAQCEPLPAPATAAPKHKPGTDPLVPKQWALTQIDAQAAWDRGFTGRNALIAIIDTGVDLTHPDLAAALVPGQRVGGSGCPGTAQDDNGHGTHVAGIAAAQGGNGIGVAGVAPHANILPLKVGQGDQVDFDAVVKAIRLAADRGADVANLSLSTGEYVPLAPSAALEPQLEAAVDYATSKGTLVVAAAGNDRNPFCKYPAAANTALCVTASDVDGNPAPYSSPGLDPDLTQSVRAPGGGGNPGLTDLCADNILATIWGPGDLGSCRQGAGYGTSAGTSMATPHVSGLAAILAAAGLTNEEIASRIRASLDGPFGIIDAGKATEGLPTPAPPPPPTPAPPPGAAPTGPSAAERRCEQARATLRRRTAARRRAERAAKRSRSSRARRLVTKRRQTERVARRDVRVRCAT